MPRICHIFDDSTGWEQRVAVNQLLDQLPSDRFTHDLVAIEPRAISTLGKPRAASASYKVEDVQPKGSASKHRTITLCARRLGLNITASLSLRTYFEDTPPDLIHAWGVNAAVAVRAATDVPIVVTLFDPVMAVRHVKALRTLTQQGRRWQASGSAGASPSQSAGTSLSRSNGSVGVACSCEIVRRRLVEGGLDEQRTVVIRPGVEFARINAATRSDLRQRLGVSRDDTLVIVPSESASEYNSTGPFTPFRRADSYKAGLFDTALAVTLLNHVHGGYRIILPQESPDTRTISRFIEGLPTASPLVYVNNRCTNEASGTAVPFEQLLAVSDVLVVPVRDDTSTTAIAWAMASKTAVIGSAVYAVAELLANKVNGLLFKPPRGRSMTVPIARLLRDHASLAKVRETARGQAYEVFGLRRFVDNYRRLYANLLSDTALAEGIADPAYQAG